MQDIFENIGSALTLSQEIVQKIENAIRQKKLLVGQKLPTEKELCTMFGVSRTALREALQSLSARGLISIRKGDGMYVSDYSFDHASKSMSLYLELRLDRRYILHLVHVRQMIEPQIAMQTARNRTDEDLAELKNNLEQFSNPEVDPHEHAMLDLEFHLKIAKACGNPIIPLMMDPVFTLLPKIKTLVVSKVIDNKIHPVLNYHQRIIDKIEEQDEQGAFDAMTEHLQHAETDTRMLIERLERDEEL